MARKKILESLGDHEKERDRHKYMLSLAEMFEFPELMEESTALINYIDELSSWMRDLWDAIDASITMEEESRSLLWADIDAENLEEEAKKLLKTVKKTNIGAKWCDAYKGAEAAAKNFVFTCPLISALKHPSMRSRHWEMVSLAPRGRKPCAFVCLCAFGSCPHVKSISTANGKNWAQSPKSDEQS